ncbi:MAG TPA: hypothetical protein VJB06_03805 [archaeon]|nr:hypothetical protein [archaeon]
MKIEEVKQKYKDEWVLVEILKEDDMGNPIDVKLITHSKNRDETREAMKKYRKQYTFHFYTGEIPKDFVAAFYGSGSCGAGTSLISN